MDKKILKTFGLDKDNSIIMLNIIVKLFPTLNENVYFCGILSKENIDDIILLDSSFNIQGMSLKIMKILKLDNSLLFQENEIPFYVICKQFVNFYKIFLQGKKQNEKENSVKKLNSLLIDSSSNLNNGTSEDNNYKEEHKEKELQENIEINENIELEYEILLPEFLIQFSESTNPINSQDKIKHLIQQTTFYDNGNLDLNNNETIDEFGENDLLVNEEDKSLITSNDGENSLKNEKNIELKNNKTLKKADSKNSKNHLYNRTKSKKSNNLNTPGQTLNEDNTPTLTPNVIYETSTLNSFKFKVEKTNDDKKLNKRQSIILNSKNEYDKDTEHQEFNLRIKKYRELF